MKKKILVLLTLYLFISCKQKSTSELVQDLKLNNNFKDCELISEKIASKIDDNSIVLLNENLKNDTIKLSNSIEVFIKYYRTNFNDFDDNDQKKAIKILTELLSFKNNQVISVESKLDLIYRDIVTQSVVNKDKNIDQISMLLDEILISYGEKGLDFMLDKYDDTKEDVIVTSIINFDSLAINHLIVSFVDNGKHQEILAQFGEPVVDLLKNLLSNKKREIRFAAAEVLVKMIKYHPEAIQSLTNAINDENLNLISSNYPFYIRLGAVDSEDLLLRSLSADFSETMALDFLNCGNSYIEDKTVIIAKKNGYNVTSGIGMHTGPRWGENKEN